MPSSNSSASENAKRRLVQKGYLYAALVFFIGYCMNILFGILSIRFGAGLPYGEPLFEFVLLFLSVIFGTAFVLKNEQSDGRPSVGGPSDT